MRQIEFFQRQKKLLEKLFSPDWFLEAKQKNYPAYLRWDLCKKIIEQGGMIQFPEQKEKLPEIGRIVLDSYIHVALTEGDIRQLKLGSLDLYGDETVQKKIRSRITDPNQFEDLMVELYVAAWHKTKNHTIELIEKDGYPDLKIEIPAMNIPVFIECKHLWTGSKNRIQKVIKKANNQIKKAVKETGITSYGAVILDVSIPVAAGQVENDNLPDKLREMVNVVQSALSGKKNRSVGAAIIVWDDYMQIGNPPDRTMLAYRRRYKRVSHTSPNLPIPENLPLFEGYTATYTLHWAPRKLPLRKYIFPELFKKECQDKFKISQAEVLKTIQKSDKTESVIFNGQKELIFFLRFISSERDYYILVCAERRLQSLVVYWAFKIFADLCDDIHLLSPIQLLARFADAYGLPITIGDLTSKFIFAHRVEVSSSDLTSLISIHNPENHSFMNCLLLKVSRKDRSTFIADCALMFCIDTTRYINWISSQNYR